MNSNLLNADNDDFNLKSLNEQITIVFLAICILSISLISSIYQRNLKRQNKSIDNKKFNTIALITSILSVLLFSFIVYVNYRNLKIIMNNPSNTQENIKMQKEQLYAKIGALIAAFLELDVVYKRYKKNNKRT